MFKKLVVLFLFILPCLMFSQDFSAQWTGHFSYNQIVDVSKGNNKIYAASTNAVFVLDTQTNTLEEISTINGLSGEAISTIYYSEIYQLLVVGYETGLIEIVFDDDDDVLTLVDIIDKPTIPPTDKRINHLNPYDNLLFVSTNYGVSVLNLERLEFGDTYFIGNNGAQIQVNQTTIYNNFIYAACADSNGLKKASLESDFLIDYQNWQQIIGGNWNSVEAIQDKLYAIRSDRNLFEIINDATSQRYRYDVAPLKMCTSENNLVVTTQNNVFIYDQNFNLTTQADINETFETQFTAAITNLDNIFIGSQDFGILRTSVTNPGSYEEVHPDGPLLNTPFSIENSALGLWVTFGEYDSFFNPYPLNRRGISHFKNGSWINVRYPEVLEAVCLNDIAINPNQLNQVFISSFFSGLLEVNDDLPTTLYNETNSDLQSLFLSNNPSYIDVRVGASTFDDDGILWITQGLVDNQLLSYNVENNQWNSFALDEIIPDAMDNNGFADIVVDSNDTKWLASAYTFGVIGVNETNGNLQIKAVFSDDDNMPSSAVTALAIDRRNQLWIGTFNGLRVLYNTSGFFTDDNVQVDEIIIEENGEARELLFQQFITDIEVDGSNNKWIGTDGAGIFYLSSDGQNTIYHFTTDNSPLPTDNINDISINQQNGVVYIATSGGLVSFQSGGSSPFGDLESAYVYPNPVRPGFDIVEKKVTIKDISENVNIKITDIEGNLVAEAQTNINQRYEGFNLEIDGGTAYWNGKNFANNVVASGVYLIMLSDLDTLETKVLKLMVVR